MWIMGHDSHRMKAMLGKQGVVRSIVAIAVWFWLVWLLADSFVRSANAAVVKDLRIALVIGNSRYKDAPLKNPANDARLMAKSLRKLGFQVLERVDVDQKGMKRAIQEFGDHLERAGAEAVGLFYYAGHGVQANGRNYLIPLGAEIQRESDLEIEALRANAVLSTMDYARNRLNFVIMDACRNNPYARSFRSTSRGLARMEAPRGTLVAYATGPNEVAMDGKGDNSPYTEALVKAMQEPGVPVEQMFKRVRLMVEEETDSKQTPWEESSLTGDFYFNPAPLEPEKTLPVTGGVAGKVPVEEPAATTAVVAARKEMMFWQSIQISENPANFEAYLKKYPDGEFVLLAKNRIKELRLAIVSLDERKRLEEERKRAEDERHRAEEANLGTGCSPANWAGKWDTTYAKMKLNVSGKSVSGTYNYGKYKIKGRLSEDACTLSGTWTHPNDGRSGPLRFTLTGNSFSGVWTEGSRPLEKGTRWRGTRVSANPKK